MREDRNHRRARPHGFTLVELLLVLTLIAVLAAIVAPSMNGGITRSRMNQAAEIVRSSWADARLKAIAEGQTMRFQCRIGSGWGIVAPAADAADSSDGDEASPADSAEGEAPGEQNHSAVVFRQLLVASQPGDPVIGAQVSEGELSAAVLFRPDGTSSDAELILEDENGLQMRVSLRGLTGVAIVEEVEVGE